ncbi:MAG: ATP-binding cassette domain-containing protein [Desulfomonilaceae bacterium]|nr:ATP-binding cassette domain-containing protein [Desulfomonilaceae bacterium]
MLEVVDLSARAGGFVLGKVSLTVQPSSCHVILGPTGSGKTLLLESVIGLRKPQEGKVILEGNEITGLPIERRGLSYVPQDLALFPHMTVRENILYPVRMRGGTQDIENGIVRELVDSLGIRHLLDRSVRNLSGGERQRTALARAMASGCTYLVLDEPLSALHESLKKELWYLLKDLQRRYDLAVLMVTHDLEEAFFLGDTVSVVLEGRVRRQGTKEDVYEHPASVEVARFLGIRNLFHVEKEGGTGDSPLVYCQDLRTTLKLSPHAGKWNPTSTSSFAVGIRSENVAILMPGELTSETHNVIEGTIEDTYASGALVTLMATGRGSSTSVEAALPRSMARRFALAKGHRVLLHLPEESLFVIDPDSREDLS